MPELESKYYLEPISDPLVWHLRNHINKMKIDRRLYKLSFVCRLLHYIDDIIADHKDKLVLNSEEVLAGKSQSLFDTVYIDRYWHIINQRSYSGFHLSVDS